MNFDEEIANNFLKKVYEYVEYEPLGNIPPDFSLNNTIGVEVRRLNQNNRMHGKIEGLETASIRLSTTIRKTLEQFITKKPCWLCVDYSRNIGDLKNIKNNLNKCLAEFEGENLQLPYKFSLNKNVNIEFAIKINQFSTNHKLGIDIDNDSGGWVIHNYITEIKHCILEKQSKTTPFYDKFSEWYLLLVDHMQCLDHYDIDKVKEEVKNLKGNFKKVIIIDISGNLLFEF